MLARSYDLNICARHDGSIYIEYFFAGCSPVRKEVVPHYVGSLIACLVEEGWEFAESYYCAPLGSTHWTFRAQIGTIIATRPLQLRP